MNIEIIRDVLIILGLANGAPILVAKVLAGRFFQPIDGGRLAPDGHPWLGSSKTWRGIFSAYVLAVPVALWLGFSLEVALWVVSLSMTGDLVSSFIKRRLGMHSSSRAFGLDQIPEAGLPLVYLWLKANLSLPEGLSIITLFIIAETVLSKILFQLHIRKQPY
jgi:CDP-2,3-bis-(O-geranylgeranyl)-sn-glycerol synthase